MANINKFSQPPIPQEESPLMRLPREIRSMILRLLLWNSRPLGLDIPADSYPNVHHSWADWKRHPLRTFSLSSQIMQCCQRLYLEGYHILYEENELAIICWIYPSMRCWFTSCLVLDKQHWFSKASRTRAESLSLDVKPVIERLLTRMRTWQVRVHCPVNPVDYIVRGYDHWNYVPCENLSRFLQNYTDDKNLLFDLHHESGEDDRIASIQSTNKCEFHRDERFWGGLQLLRCKRAVLTGLDSTIAARLKTAMESSTPVLDVLDQCDKIYNLIYETIPSHATFLSTNAGIFDKLRLIAYNGDQDSFVQTRDEVLNIVEAKYTAREQLKLEEISTNRAEFDMRQKLLRSSSTTDISKSNVLWVRSK